MSVAYSSAALPYSNIAPLVAGVLTFSPGETTRSFTANVSPVPGNLNDAFLINLIITYADGVVVNSVAYGHVGHYDVPPDDPWS